MARIDPHSYADDGQPSVTHLDWDARVDFGATVITAEAVLRLAAAPVEAVPLDLDTRGLVIETVETERGQSLAWDLADPDPVLGARLRVHLTAGVDGLRIRYRTGPNASALQWLAPDQTSSGAPFLYSQCQAIHARSLIPVQDTPSRRITYTAALRVPSDLQALMAAEALGTEPSGGATAVARFRMPQPIAPYLFALAVGMLEARDLGARTRVWAEPAILDAAAHEFADVDAMLTTGERLFGPYDWERYDLLVLPAAFPYGGMENPRLTFLTPTVVAGDRSQVSVVAHELAHSWTGNLVSNANAEHFWLNEGFTTYAERRIVEALSGVEAAALDWALGRRALDEAIALFKQQGQTALTLLRTRLEGLDPDEGYSVVPYEKGALFLRALEDAVGRERFDHLLHAYITRFRFQALTTEDFEAFAEEQLPGALALVGSERWLREPGVPSDAPRMSTARLDAIESLGTRLPSDTEAAAWRAVEWELYVESLPEDVSTDVLAEIDGRFHLTAAKGYDVLTAWLALGLKRGYAPAVARAEEVLGTVGRMKYLKPLYRVMAGRAETRQLARALYDRFQPRYHPIARQVIPGVLESAGG
ncbi:MAG: M1 family metallopeptidase [Chloroflexi bacterium]|nr:M1 family metallopeptidase [Chloroflexota bacterium]